MHKAESRVRSFTRNKNHDKQRVILLFNFECPFEGTPKYGGVAQLGEHLPCKQGVKGSSPFISTTGCAGALARGTSQETFDYHTMGRERKAKDAELKREVVRI